MTSLTVCTVKGGPELDDLTSMPLAQASKADANAPSVWRSFTNDEDSRLEAAWNALEEDSREKAWRAKIRGENRSGKSSAASSRRNSSVERPKEKPVPDPVDEADTQEEVVEEETQKGYLADMEREALPHIVHVSQDRLFSADLLCTSLYYFDHLGAAENVIQPCPCIQSFGRAVHLTPTRRLPS